MVICGNCGYQHQGAKFCPECGKPQNADDIAASNQQFVPTQETAEEAVWEGESKDIKNLISDGRLVSSRYQLTNRTLYFTEGLISTVSQQVPLWAVRDIDVRQGFLQKSRGVGDVTVHVQHSDYTGTDAVYLLDIEQPVKIRDLLNQHAQRERLSYDQRQKTRYYGR